MTSATEDRSPEAASELKDGTGAAMGGAVERPALALGRGRFLAFLGPATMVSVGYMDPGNWATDLEGGARFGYQLLWVLVISNAMALLLQTLSARLGMVSGLDLASACRSYYTKSVAVWLWLLAELAIIACDMAEILGSAVALNLLFGMPMILGALLTVFDVLLILALQRRGARTLEAVVAALLLTIAACLTFELFLAKPSAGAIASGLVPRLSGESLYIAIGILGATVMPHNLYLHSALVPRLKRGASFAEGQKEVKRSVGSTALALNLALFLNASILIVAAAVFSTRGMPLTDLREAHGFLTPLLGSAAAAALFAVGLLCAGQSATITGTLAGQIVMEGFVRLRVSPVTRRAITRGLAVVPAVAVLAIVGEDGTMPLLVASQVVLSLQLPFAIVPLIRFTNSRHIMGPFVNGSWTRSLAIVCAVLVSCANAALVIKTLAGWQEKSSIAALLFGSVVLAAAGLLGWLCIAPLRQHPGGASGLRSGYRTLTS